MASRGSMTSRLVALLAITAMTLIMAQGYGLCPGRCRCNDETLHASCANAGLDQVPIQLNPEVRHLDLSGNRVVNLRMTFSFYTSLESLNLAANLIHTLGTKNFDQQQRLVKLNVSNNDVRTIARSALHGLSGLRELDLSGNNITEIEEGAFKSTSELEYLVLSGNSMTSLPDGLLKNLHRIRVLMLSRNSLLEVPCKNLALVPSLEKLDLSDNLIQDLGEDSLPYLRSLVYLSAANNVIRSISPKAFDHLPGLLYLDLSGNNLTSVPTASLAKLRVLSTLILSRNPLGSVQPKAFRNLFEMRRLELEDCSVEMVHARALADNVNLELVSLAGNRELRELPDKLLNHARYLRWVSLRRCNLATLHSTSIPIDGLSSLLLGGNPMTCNCSLSWLWSLMRDHQARDSNESISSSSSSLSSTSTSRHLVMDQVLCSDEEFAGKSLASLPEGALRCRLNALYLALSIVACLTATIAILALITHVTRVKRRKPLNDYTGNVAASLHRPELLFVGRDGLSAKLSSRLPPPPATAAATATATAYNHNNRSSNSLDSNIYEMPRCHQNNISISGPPAAPIPAYFGHQQRYAGEYAVADVTNLHSNVMSLMYPAASTTSHFDYFEDTDEENYSNDEYEMTDETVAIETNINSKPHIVFV